MSGYDEDKHHNPRTATEVARQYARQGERLLERLAEAGSHAERRGDQVVIVRKGGRLALSAGMPTGVLAALIESGAVACSTKGGRSEFRITEAGQARLRRAAAGESETPFADQHRCIVERSDGEGGTQRVNLREDPLELFRRARGFALIGEAELAAGDRLRADLTSAQALPQVTANWSRLVVDGAGYSGELNLSERVIAARSRVDAALRAVGPDFSGILVDVCGFSKGLETLERDHALPQRAGKVALGFGLRALARHYGLSSEARGKDRVPMRQWGAPDCRPTLHARQATG